ncbi:MAG: hypothetical protein OEW08_14350, partial [Gammaproteobacteria bacterium]|nr:hypothetical protein [Gammaproteobacteria bacterium]
MKLQGMRIIHHFSTLLALFSAISIPAQAIADLEPHLGQLTFTTGHKFGETLYQIGGAYSTNIGPGFQPFPTSELRFPLTLPTATIAFIQPIREKYTFAIRLETSYTTHSGLVKDSDWLTNPSVPDIYSESRSYGSFKEGGIEFNMRISKFRLPGELKLGCELDYMHYAYEIFDLAQTSNLPKYYTGVVSGAVGRYQVSYFIPYLQ